MELVIVESPTKAKTIGKFVGKNYTVESSYGHIRDLPKSKVGIDVEHDFEPQYVVPIKAKPVVANLKALAAKADKVILATDEDREGEAIAWHLISALDLKKIKVKTERIAFHEITESAIKEALKNPRELDINLVDAQQARRVLDRLVGYGLSPFLWRKVRYGLSAGRVQSVAVRLIVERERQIQAFNKEEYWSIEGMFLPPKGKNAFPASLYSVSGKTLGKMDIKNEKEAKALTAALEKAHYEIAEISVREVRRNPSAPFTTSTLQQEAARKLGFSAKQTMVVAQKLYENGHITYMRTDSVNLANTALVAAQEVIGTEFGKQYQLAEPRRYTTRSKGAQEAHEAIRPTNLGVTSGSALGIKERNDQRLYDLIWKRTIASQMKEALLEQTAVDIRADTAKKEIFRANGQTVKFDGFIRAYTEGRDEGENGGEVEGQLPKLEKGMKLSAEEIKPLQHFTEPPPRYTDATLVKALEAEGIGRPSTYAPTLSTIQDRGYVEKLEKKYHPTDIGFVVNDLLVENFPDIVDIKFTSHIEEEFDEVAEGKIKWTEVCREFYGPFKKELDEKEATVEKQVEISTVPCPHCGKPMIIKFGRMGKFLACPEPGVKVTLPMPEEAAQIKALEEKTKDERCPICGKPMKVRRGRFGFFLGCTDYPKCKGVSKIWNKTGFKCPNCLESPDRHDKPGDIVEKKSRGRGKPFFACTRYPDCTFVMNKKPESQEELDAAFKNWKENPPKPKEKKEYKKTVSAGT
ncbi:MAG TPA: type I DNA topoisomerase [Candidatus Paceibacterota bacterium]|jgi:DNA topoisomerase-1|nr:type I DNA topoisomerase [Candidatus Paceibacterota bacterium]